MTEFEKMLSGEYYYSMDPDLIQQRARCRKLLYKINHEDLTDEKKRKDYFTELFEKDVDAYIEPPFHCDYGINISIGKKTYLNFGCVLLDCAKITIGENCLLAPNVQLYAATHPISPALRWEEKEYAKPIIIEDNVWIGGASIICPGVRIGKNSVVAAGSVVTKDVPANVLVGGNPARILKRL